MAGERGDQQCCEEKREDGQYSDVHQDLSLRSSVAPDNAGGRAYLGTAKAREGGGESPPRRTRKRSIPGMQAPLIALG
ncbi:hypothetical protein GCM10009789_42460 [Kribbella sancticallisti]|uniref:Uncharacterized protein n=1 Tax=Kribbella sancticallisti TaxID=460087 RepID=A0ABP4PKW4_9ACTN